MQEILDYVDGDDNDDDADDGDDEQEEADNDDALRIGYKIDGDLCNHGDGDDAKSGNSADMEHFYGDGFFSLIGCRISR